jgi:hypothetical protein
MTPTQQLDLSPISTAIDNVDAWPGLAQQISARAGLPTELTPELICGMLGSAVPLLFAADAAHNVDLLRGTFADPVIAQCERNAGQLAGARPFSAAVHLVGTPVANGQPALRTHLKVEVQTADAAHGVSGQFWDLQLGAQAVVAQATCPNCGAPIAGGHLICEHCGTDVRSVVSVPLIVGRLEIY